MDVKCLNLYRHNLGRHWRIIRVLCQKLEYKYDAVPEKIFDDACVRLQTYIAYRDADFSFEEQAALFEELCNLRESLDRLIKHRHYWCAQLQHRLAEQERVDEWHTLMVLINELKKSRLCIGKA